MHIVEKEFKLFIDNQKDVGKFCVAYSGGVDSQVLLYLSSKYIEKETLALHVNHGISNNANEWNEFCSKTSTKYNIRLISKRFNLKEEKSNLEEKARELRYEFFKDHVKENDALMTGHHLDDQAETFLLRLMRGAGVDGLSSMQPEREFNGGKLIRPLLNVSKEEIIDFANSVNLEWVEDESNKDTHYDRNFIRNDVMPLLKTRWKHANKSIARSASHCQKSKEQTEEVAIENLKLISFDHRSVMSSVLEEMDVNSQKAVIRQWIKSKGFKMPDEKALNVIVSEVLFARQDSKACFTSKEYEIKKSFDLIYFVPKDEEIIFETNNDYIDISMDKTNVKMFYEGKMRKLKDILKNEKVPEWERDFYPVYTSNNQVLAVGDILSGDILLAGNDLKVKKIYK